MAQEHSIGVAVSLSGPHPAASNSVRQAALRQTCRPDSEQDLTCRHLQLLLQLLILIPLLLLLQPGSLRQHARQLRLLLDATRRCKAGDHAGLSPFSKSGLEHCPCHKPQSVRGGGGRGSRSVI